MLIATPLQVPNSDTSPVIAADPGEGGDPGHIGDILVSSYVSARIAMLARTSSGSRLWANTVPELCNRAEGGADCLCAGVPSEGSAIEAGLAARPSPIETASSRPTVTTTIAATNIFS